MRSEDSGKGGGKRERGKKVHKRKTILSSLDPNWALAMLLTSFLLTVLFSYIANNVVVGFRLFPAMLILLFFILLGILFDIIGMAVTSCDEKVFHSMASRRVYGARECIWLIRHVDRVANFCNDVIGDICGIISGATATVIIASLFRASRPENTTFWTLILTGLVASVTIGGKALGKGVAIHFDRAVVFMVGRTLHFFKTIVGKGEK